MVLDKLNGRSYLVQQLYFISYLELVNQKGIDFSYGEDINYIIVSFNIESLN